MKDVIWVGSSKKDLSLLPVAVKKEIGFALFQAQCGGLHVHAKPFKGHGSGVYEIVLDHDKNAYRAVYVVNIADVLYVLHVFQKKSKQGIKTPQKDIDLIAERLKRVKDSFKS